MPLVLHGYRYSVYVRIARLALAEKRVAYDRVEVNPFAPDVPASYPALHPFGRVPTLVHDGFTLYETGAITRYIDRAFPGPALQPTDPQALARMDQIIGIADAYAYWPLVRQVFSHRVFRPSTGRPGDETEIARGAQASAKVLAALEPLVGDGVTLADLHLGAMIAYFVQAPEGRQALRQHPRLAAWWARLSARPGFAATDPGLPGAPAPQSR
ncbi:MAG: glutathione S-transferase family protein [Proteobacteria bacterium]|nr:glutathione S-transferase family protein [Pseudomonadota bacterium]